MQKRLFGLLLVISSSSLLSSCATQAPNEPVCFEITMDRGGCIRPITGEEFEINEENKYQGKTWWEMRPAMIMLPPTTWEKIRGFIIKICKQSNQCQSEVSSWDRTVENIDKKVQERLP